MRSGSGVFMSVDIDTYMPLMDDDVAFNLGAHAAMSSKIRLMVVRCDFVYDAEGMIDCLNELIIDHTSLETLDAIILVKDVKRQELDGDTFVKAVTDRIKEDFDDLKARLPERQFPTLEFSMDKEFFESYNIQLPETT
ncbi:uncharacterized protein LY89DRAFT_737487 [Mollisia scopiformis]|uniref:Uncharacterized protein n=1 Tax=Mollisia scopiformis TaxID=149040 RepID=A0A194WZY4_MOLSC|nr:uncharacterized protein LY89DRAFT_737487 [Mollisia scopiformis]KUJ13508.1 hypothetical protein LY89DRAFT_737487 [Mollisia scopiformis]